jgi:hypothetical protein
MEGREFDFDEPVIFCSHNFDICNRENFANELATRLGVNINITQGGGDEIIGTIKIPNATSTKNLYCQSSKFDPDLKYVLEHGDEAHLFYGDYLQYDFPFIVDYEILVDELKNPTGDNDDYEHRNLNLLKKFGATEVHISNMEEVKLSDEDKKEWSKVLKVIGNLKSHYLYKLP